MNVDEESDQRLDLVMWMHQGGSLVEAFVHIHEPRHEISNNVVF